MKQREDRLELRKLDAEALTEQLRSIREELFKLRLRHASGQLEKTSQLTNLKRRIALILTLQKEAVAAAK